MGGQLTLKNINLKKPIDIKGSGGGGGSSDPRPPYEAPNSLRSTSVARVLDIVSEGEIEGLQNGLKGVYLDEVAVQNSNDTYNFEGVEITERVGAPDQDGIMLIFLPIFHDRLHCIHFGEYPLQPGFSLDPQQLSSVEKQIGCLDGFLQISQCVASHVDNETFSSFHDEVFDPVLQSTGRVLLEHGHPDDTETFREHFGIDPGQGYDLPDQRDLRRLVGFRLQDLEDHL